MKKHTRKAPKTTGAVLAKPRRVQIKITTSTSVSDALRQLVQSGLYGNSVSEAAERLVCEALVDRMKKSLQERMNAK